MPNVPLMDLWMPIVLSAVIVFIVSSIMHMLLPFHKSDYRKMPDEEKVADALRAAGVTPGPTYIIPHCDHSNMKSPETLEKFKRGPVGLITIRPSGEVKMGPFLMQWTAYCLLVSIFTAYLTGHSRAPGTHYLEVFRVAGCAAFMAYGVGLIPDSIWKGQTWTVTLKHVIDGLIYGLLTAGTFGWLWPKS